MAIYPHTAPSVFLESKERAVDRAGGPVGRAEARLDKELQISQLKLDILSEGLRAAEMGFCRWWQLTKDVEPGAALPVGMSRRAVILGEAMLACRLNTILER